jgi:hypothetical protein
MTRMFQEDEGLQRKNLNHRMKNGSIRRSEMTNKWTPESIKKLAEQSQLAGLAGMMKDAKPVNYEALIKRASEYGFEAAFQGDAIKGSIIIHNPRDITEPLMSVQFREDGEFTATRKVEGPNVQANYGVEHRIVSATMESKNLEKIWDSMLKDAVEMGQNESDEEKLFTRERE